MSSRAGNRALVCGVATQATLSLFPCSPWGSWPGTPRGLGRKDRDQTVSFRGRMKRTRQQGLHPGQGPRATVTPNLCPGQLESPSRAGGPFPGQPGHGTLTVCARVWASNVSPCKPSTILRQTHSWQTCPYFAGGQTEAKGTLTRS